MTQTARTWSSIPGNGRTPRTTAAAADCRTPPAASARTRHRPCPDSRHGRALFGEDQAVRQLLLAPRINAIRERRAVEQFAVRPDPPDPGDLPFAERHGEVGEVAELGRLRFRPALAAVAFGPRLLLEIGRPDDLPGQPRPPIKPRQHRPFRRALDLEVGKPRPARLRVEPNSRWSRKFPAIAPAARPSTAPAPPNTEPSAPPAAPRTRVAMRGS
jgi:hypothetical protein